MNANYLDAVDLDENRWRAARRGLQLSGNSLGLGLMVLLYFAWILVVGVLCLILIIPSVLTGKTALFEQSLNTVALYTFVLPLALIVAITWMMKFVSALLLCAIPSPATAPYLAFAAALGRVAVLVATVLILLSPESFSKTILLTPILACSAIAWLGLAAEGGYFRTLRCHFLTVNSISVASEADTEETPEFNRSAWKRDLGKWFKQRYPRAHKISVWVGVPLLYLAILWTQNNDRRSFLDSLLRLAAIMPAVLQIFSIFSRQTGELILALSPKSIPDHVPTPAI